MEAECKKNTTLGESLDIALNWRMLLEESISGEQGCMVNQVLLIGSTFTGGSPHDLSAKYFGEYIELPGPDVPFTARQCTYP